MCTIIVTIRTVLWYVMSLASTLFILVALFTNRWLEGTYSASVLTSKGEQVRCGPKPWPCPVSRFAVSSKNKRKVIKS